MISNFVLHNAVQKLTRKCGCLGEMTCPANMGHDGWAANITPQAVEKILCIWKLPWLTTKPSERT